MLLETDLKAETIDAVQVAPFLFSFFAFSSLFFRPALSHIFIASERGENIRFRSQPGTRDFAVLRNDPRFPNHFSSRRHNRALRFPRSNPKITVKIASISFSTSLLTGLFPLSHIDSGLAFIPLSSPYGFFVGEIVTRSTLTCINKSVDSANFTRIASSRITRISVVVLLHCKNK